jgi:hypothetical protein
MKLPRFIRHLLRLNVVRVIYCNDVISGKYPAAHDTICAIKNVANNRGYFARYAKIIVRDDAEPAYAWFNWDFPGEWRAMSADLVHRELERIRERRNMEYVMHSLGVPYEAQP